MTQGGFSRKSSSRQLIQTPLSLSDTLGDCLEMRRDEREEESRRRSFICPKNYPSFLLAEERLIILGILGRK